MITCSFNNSHNLSNIISYNIMLDLKSRVDFNKVKYI